MYVLHSEQNLFPNEANFIEGGVDFLAHLENSKQKSKSNSTCHI